MQMAWRCLSLVGRMITRGVVGTLLVRGSLVEGSANRPEEVSRFVANHCSVEYILGNINLCLIFFHFSKLRWCRYFKSITDEDKDPFVIHNQYHNCWWPIAGRNRAPSQYEDDLSKYGHFRDKDETVVRPSYLYDGNPYTGKTPSLSEDMVLIYFSSRNIPVSEQEWLNTECQIEINVWKC